MEYLRRGLSARCLNRSENHVEYLHMIVDYSSWFNQFPTSKVRKELKHFRMNRWQFTAIPGELDNTVDVLINQYGCSLTDSELRSTYWSKSCHGAFGFEVMRRYFANEKFASQMVRRLYRHFAWALNPQISHFLCFLYPDRSKAVIPPTFLLCFFLLHLSHRLRQYMVDPLR